MLRRFLLALSLSTALVSADVSEARAAPVFVAVGAFVATPLGGIVAQAAVALAVGAISNLIKQATRKPAQAPRAATAAGVRGTVAGGDDVPIGFITGDRATAGSMAYHGRWGTLGGTPNAYHVEERILSDIPMPGLPGIWIKDQLCTVLWDEEPAEQGYPIEELRVDGVDHGWVRYHDGTQTEADSYMLSKFGEHETRPYLDDMIGVGQAKAIITLLVNRNLFKGGLPSFLFVSSGIALYDISRDSTAGGDGDQRRDDPSTWQPCNLLPVQIYNVLMGIRWNGEWVWGMQDAPAASLPASSWIAAINEARAPTARADGTTEPQFAGGFEITGDMEPQAVIKEMLKGCAGRIAEIGGTYKMLCGLPASSVFSFTDRDILVTRERGFNPWPTLDQTFNGIQGSHPLPSAKWAFRDAPLRHSPEFQAADLGKRNVANVRYEVVYSPTQVQRLMSLALNDARRFRRHSHYLPPEASELEPLDMVSWSSDSQGYTAKKFLITDMDDEPNYIDFFNFQEVDPGDIDYDAEVDERPFTVGTLSTSRPPVQAVTDWGVAQWTHVDNALNARRPGIAMFWDGQQPDVRALLYEVRLAETDEIALTGEIATRFNTGFGTTPAGALLGATDYEVRGLYDPFSARDTAWSEWLPVTTPDIPEVPPITPDMLGQEMLNQVFATMAQVIARQDDIEIMLGDNAQVIMEGDLERQEQARGLSLRTASSAASVVQLEEVVLGPNGAFAQFTQSTNARIDLLDASGFFRLTSEVSPETGITIISFGVKATNGEWTSVAAFELGAQVTEDGAQSFIRMMADRLDFLSTAGEYISQPFAISGEFVELQSVKFTNLLSYDLTSLHIFAGDAENEAFIKGGFAP